MQTTVLVLCASIVLQSAAQLIPVPSPPGEDEDVDLDLCESCTRSRETCISEALAPTLCHCDTECELYHDCCEDRPQCREPPVLTGVPESQCSSTGLDDRPVTTVPAYWMVSICPSDRQASSIEETWIEGNCTNGSRSLPPVSDQNTGVVYINEYCAICNGVEGILPWSYTLSCSEGLLEMLKNPNFTLTVADIERECTLCRFTAPNLTSTILTPRPCRITVASCMGRTDLEAHTNRTWNESAYDQLVELCEQGPYSLVGNSKSELVLPYRNQYCAECNGIDTEGLNCHRPREIESCEEQTEIRPSGSPFSLLLDVRGDSLEVHSEEITTTIEITCFSGEVFDPVSANCRPTLCPDGFAQSGGGACMLEVPANNVTNETASNVSTIDCMGVFIALNDSEYEDLGNNTVLFNGEVFEVEFNDTLGQPVICANFSQNGTSEVNVTRLYFSYPPEFIPLTIAGSTLSLIGSALILLTYTLFAELRTLPSKLLMNLAAAILLSNFFLLIGAPINEAVQSSGLCTAVAIVLHFLFLSQFSWMSIMVFETSRTFSHAVRLAPRESNRFKRRLLTTYLVLGWSIPTTIVLLSIIVNFTTENLVLYGELDDGTQGSCWINHPASIGVAFIFPVAVAVLFNAVLFAFIIVLLSKPWYSGAWKHKDRDHIPYLRVYSAIFSISGLTWIFGFIAILIRTRWAWDVYIILNSIQGITIFAAFLLTKKVTRLYLSCLQFKMLETKSPSTKSSVAKNIAKENVHHSRNGNVVTENSYNSQNDTQKTYPNDSSV